MEKKTLKGIIIPGIILFLKEPPELIPSRFSPVITHHSPFIIKLEKQLISFAYSRLSCFSYRY